MSIPKYPGVKQTINGNQLVATTEARISDCGVFYPITPSTEQGEYFEMSVSSGTLSVFGDKVKAIETEGEHAAQGGAIAISVTGKRVSNFTSGQGIVYGLEQYYHAPGKLSTMVLNVGARALTKHALNVHCGHDDIMAAMDTGWIMLMAKDAQQAVDQTIILRKVTELSLNPGMNIQDGFLTTHLQRTFKSLESGLLREYLGHPADTIDCPTEAQVELFGKTRRRVPDMYNLKTPLLLGPVQNQEHYMTGVVSRRISFTEPIIDFIQQAMDEFAVLTGRHYGLVSEYNCTKADTIFLSLGSSAENIEAAVDYIKATKGDEVGVCHLNVIRPFPEKALIKILKGKKNVIILERTDEPTAGSNPISREVRTALAKAHENEIANFSGGIGRLKESEIPHIFEGVYGLGSRDFRPEHILGAYQYTQGQITRQDGKKASDGASFFYLGVKHPYAVLADDTPSLLPESAISVRLHSIGGWGAITTGKNMAEILGNLSRVSKFAKNTSDDVIHISANPKYGSEKKGAPTNYFLAVARERIKVNCDLKHVDVVLCCDPKIFTHANPLEGLRPGGAFLWESNLLADEVWARVPRIYRQQLIDNNIKFYTLNGFEIAKSSTKSESLQTRMQGNSFLGAFFKVSTFLSDHAISHDVFLDTVLKQYQKKFGKFGEDVVESNLSVMKKGFENLKEIPLGQVEAVDHSALKGNVICPENFSGIEEKVIELKGGCELKPIYSLENYQSEFQNGNPYDQAATPLMSTGTMPGATSANNSKFVSRIKTPVIDPYKCTQCMSCIEVCPDTALPNTSQDIDRVLANIFTKYVTDNNDRDDLSAKVESITAAVREIMNAEIALKNNPPREFNQIVWEIITAQTNISSASLAQIKNIMVTLPLGYGKTRPIFQMLEKKNAGDGGLFSIFVSDLCKGCGECVTACGDHMALEMVDEDLDVRGKHLSAIEFFKTLPQTPRKYLGLFDPENMEKTRAAILANHLMIQENYNALVSGDGACAGCGEKSVLRGVASITEGLMRPVFNHKAARLLALSLKIKENGESALKAIKTKDIDTYNNVKMAIGHLIMGLGGESLEDTQERFEQESDLSDSEMMAALTLVLEVDGYNHQKFKIIDGKSYGMSVMGMTANTGCNTVYGSTHPSNPHPYPWMNSLFQDGTTIGWLVAESFMLDHAKRSVIPERLSNLILEGASKFSTRDYLELAHLDDTHMTDLELMELPKVWVIGGDGGIGDIGFQNLSKVILQNRPNVHVLMLDTQVYSNTGGQNSDSSVMPGGFDMNQFGEYHEGKLTERKEVAQILTSGHGSPYVASVSMANSGKFFKSVLDALIYRGSAFIQSFTTCQPEHGVADNVSQVQAIKIRDCRGAVEFVYDPSMGEFDCEAFDLKGNPRTARDWGTKRDATKAEYDYTIPHWAATESRFKKHFIKLKKGEDKYRFEDVLLRVTQNDVQHRYFMDEKHRSFVPIKGIYIDLVDDNGKIKRVGVSRHLVLFSVERRKNWRRLQSKAQIKNSDYQAQKILLERFDKGELPAAEFFNNTTKCHRAILETL